jgi:hypothetical protein
MKSKRVPKKFRKVSRKSKLRRKTRSRGGGPTDRDFINDEHLLEQTTNEILNKKKTPSELLDYISSKCPDNKAEWLKNITTFMKDNIKNNPIIIQILTNKELYERARAIGLFTTDGIPLQHSKDSGFGVKINDFPLYPLDSELLKIKAPTIPSPPPKATERPRPTAPARNRYVVDENPILSDISTPPPKAKVRPPPLPPRNPYVNTNPILPDTSIPPIMSPTMPAEQLVLPTNVDELHLTPENKVDLMKMNLDPEKLVFVGQKMIPPDSSSEREAFRNIIKQKFKEDDDNYFLVGFPKKIYDGVVERLLDKSTPKILTFKPRNNYSNLLGYLHENRSKLKTMQEESRLNLEISDYIRKISVHDRKHNRELLNALFKNLESAYKEGLFTDNGLSYESEQKRKMEYMSLLPKVISSAKPNVPQQRNQKLAQEILRQEVKRQGQASRPQVRQTNGYDRGDILPFEVLVSYLSNLATFN